jgi:hypothetical protein
LLSLFLNGADSGSLDKNLVGEGRQPENAPGSTIIAVLFEEKFPAIGDDAPVLDFGFIHGLKSLQIALQIRQTQRKKKNFKAAAAILQKVDGVGLPCYFLRFTRIPPESQRPGMRGPRISV